MPKTRRLIGSRFGKLRVVAELKQRKCGKKTWLCRCDCGGRSSPTTGALTSGNTRSCGCSIGKPSGQGHGQARAGKLTPEYVAWQSMKDRCHNRNSQAWSGYGGRGIEVCFRWRNSFEEFFTDIGLRPTPERSLDRINNDGNYEPGNVRWATRRQQNLNTRRGRVIRFGSHSMSLPEWADYLGVACGALRLRLKAGWSEERTLSTPMRCRKLSCSKAEGIRKEYEAGGETYESLGRKHGVGADHIGKILIGKRWK